MEAGVARQCSRNRCLARWTVWVPIVAAEARQVERTRRKTCSRAQSEFLCPSGRGNDDRVRMNGPLAEVPAACEVRAADQPVVKAGRRT